MGESSQREMLVSYIIKRKYEKQGITLPEAFWRLPKYKKEYQQQTIIAAKLFRAYSEEAIWNTIRKESWCWSLYAKKLPDLIEVEQARLTNEKNLREHIAKQNPQVTPCETSPLFRKKN